MLRFFYASYGKHITFVCLLRFRILLHSNMPQRLLECAEHNENRGARRANKKVFLLFRIRRAGRRALGVMNLFLGRLVASSDVTA